MYLSSNTEVMKVALHTNHATTNLIGLPSIIIFPHGMANPIPFLYPFSIFVQSFPLCLLDSTTFIVSYWVSRFTASKIGSIVSTSNMWLWLRPHANTTSTCVSNDQNDSASNTQKCVFKTPKQCSMVVRKKKRQRLISSLSFIGGWSLNSFKWYRTPW